MTKCITKEVKKNESKNKKLFYNSSLKKPKQDTPEHGTYSVNVLATSKNCIIKIGRRIQNKTSRRRNLPIRSLKEKSYDSQNYLNTQEKEELKNLDQPFQIKKQEIENLKKFKQNSTIFPKYQQKLVEDPKNDSEN